MISAFVCSLIFWYRRCCFFVVVLFFRGIILCKPSIDAYFVYAFVFVGVSIRCCVIVFPGLLRCCNKQLCLAAGVPLATLACLWACVQACVAYVRLCCNICNSPVGNLKVSRCVCAITYLIIFSPAADRRQRQIAIHRYVTTNNLVIAWQSMQSCALTCICEVFKILVLRLVVIVVAK